MFFISFLSSAVAGNMHETDAYKSLTKTCEKSFDVTFEEASFKGSELGVDMGRSWCAQTLHGVRTTCTDTEKRKDMQQLQTIRCVHDSTPKDRVAARVEGTTLILGINRRTGNLKSDVYEWTMRMAPPEGGPSAEERGEKADGQAAIDRQIALITKYCRNPEPLTVTIDWDSFAPILDEDAERKAYGYGGIYGGCTGAAGVVQSICTERFKPEPAQLSPTDEIKGVRCVYAAGAREPVMSLEGGILTAGYDDNTGNMVGVVGAFVRQNVPR